MRIVLDTDVVSLHRAGRLPPRYRRHLVGNELFIAFATAGELWKGALAAQWGTTRRGGLDLWLDQTAVLPAGLSVALTRRCGMQTTTTYLDRVRPAIEQVGERFAALVATAADPDHRVPHSPDWTVREAAAHVVTVALRFAAGPERRGTWVPDPRGLPELNDAEIRALGTSGMEQLAERLRRDLTAVCDQVEGYGPAPPSFRFHGGEPVPADLALGILLAELVVHGWDIAQALRRPWPIDPGHVALIFDGLVPILPGWVDPDQASGLTATFEVRLRGQATHVFAFRDGRLRMNPEQPRRVDAHVSADPATLLLVVYRRRSQWPQIAAGRLLAWGRRPWLALSFVRRFHKP